MTCYKRFKFNYVIPAIPVCSFNQLNSVLLVWVCAGVFTAWPSGLFTEPCFKSKLLINLLSVELVSWTNEKKYLSSDWDCRHWYKDSWRLSVFLYFLCWGESNSHHCYIASSPGCISLEWDTWPRVGYCGVSGGWGSTSGSWVKGKFHRVWCVHFMFQRSDNNPITSE